MIVRHGKLRNLIRGGSWISASFAATVHFRGAEMCTMDDDLTALRLVRRAA